MPRKFEIHLIFLVVLGNNLMFQQRCKIASNRVDFNSLKLMFSVICMTIRSKHSPEKQIGISFTDSNKKLLVLFFVILHLN